MLNNLANKVKGHFKMTCLAIPSQRTLHIHDFTGSLTFKMKISNEWEAKNDEDWKL